MATATVDTELLTGVPCLTASSRQGFPYGVHRKKALIQFKAFLFMVTVYVLQSMSDDSRCTGMAIDPIHRLKEHNAGKSRFTKAHRPWKIICTETHPDWAIARQREKYLKSAAGRKWLQQQLIRNS